MWLWTEKTAEVTQAAASLVGTLKDTALAILHGRGTASGEAPGPIEAAYKRCYRYLLCANMLATFGRDLGLPA